MTFFECESSTSSGDILDKLFRSMVRGLAVVFSNTSPSPETVTVKPLLKVTGGTTNQNCVLSSAVAPRATGVSQTRVILSAASSAITTVGVPPIGIVTVALPASFSPLLPFRVMDDTVTPSPYRLSRRKPPTFLYIRTLSSETEIIVFAPRPKVFSA